jgi:hypothetical protein
MMLNLLFLRIAPLDGEVLARFGEACLLRLTSGRYELRGGSWRDREAAKEWASLFCQEASWSSETGTNLPPASLHGGR